MNLRTFFMLSIPALLGACSTATQPPPQPTVAASPVAAAPAPSAAATEKPRIVRSRDGTYDGEMVGTAAPGSLLAKVQIGMNGDEVVKVMGRPPTRSHTYESGKRWIPLYFGNDATRMQVLYEGEGCLIYSAGNRFVRTTPDLIRIEFDASGKCYQP